MAAPGLGLGGQSWREWAGLGHATLFVRSSSSSLKNEWHEAREFKAN